MATTMSQWRRFTPNAASLTPHTTGAQLDLLRNPLRARQRMTACKTASIDALWPQFITTVANEAGPTHGQAHTSGRVDRRRQATVAEPPLGPRPGRDHYHQNLVDHDNGSQVDCSWRRDGMRRRADTTLVRV